MGINIVGGIDIGTGSGGGGGGCNCPLATSTTDGLMSAQQFIDVANITTSITASDTSVTYATNPATTAPGGNLSTNFTVPNSYVMLPENLYIEVFAKYQNDITIFLPDINALGDAFSQIKDNKFYTIINSSGSVFDVTIKPTGTILTTADPVFILDGNYNALASYSLQSGASVKMQWTYSSSQSIQLWQIRT
jgi:hypothetical protein